MAAALHIWMNGRYVGVWSTSRNGVQTFQYDDSWTRAVWGRALSLSLPFTEGNGEHRGAAVANYFENLLPDSLDIRKRLVSRFKTKSTQAFDLLAAIGRDCVGAVQILPEGAQPQDWNRVECEPLTESDVERILRTATTDAPLGQHQDDGDFRISIAGAQEKTALLRFGGVWQRPLGATPTTHILKLPLGLVGNMRADMRDSVENEWLCAQIVAALGLRMATTEMARFGTQKALVVERFDRRWQNLGDLQHNRPGFTPPTVAWIARLPQEDLCQATGTSPLKKYESDGGPSMRNCLDVLAGSAQAAADCAHFALTQLAFWLLAATDGHAKNYSLWHQRGGTFGLTPLYDVLSAWPIIGEGPNLVSEHKATLAIALRAKTKHYKLGEIRVRHWQALAQSCGAPNVWPKMQGMVRRVDAALAQVQTQLPADFPPRVWDAVQAGIRKHAQQFLRETDTVAR